MNKLLSTTTVRYGTWTWIWAHPSPAAIRAYAHIRGIIAHVNAGACTRYDICILTVMGRRARHREMKPLAPTRVPCQNAPHSSLASDLTYPSLFLLSASTHPAPTRMRLNAFGSAPTPPFPKPELWEGKEGYEPKRDEPKDTEGVKG
jgi:hypothetical protein